MDVIGNMGTLRRERPQYHEGPQDFWEGRISLDLPWLGGQHLGTARDRLARDLSIQN